MSIKTFIVTVATKTIEGTLNLAIKLRETSNKSAKENNPKAQKVSKFLTKIINKLETNKDSYIVSFRTNLDILTEKLVVLWELSKKYMKKFLLFAKDISLKAFYFIKDMIAKLKKHLEEKKANEAKIKENKIEEVETQEDSKEEISEIENTESIEEDKNIKTKIKKKIKNK